MGLAAPNLAELEVTKTQPSQREGATMTEITPSPLNNVITIDDERIKNHLDRVVRGSVEETLNALLDAEADRLCNAQRYERSAARRDTRAGPDAPRALLSQHLQPPALGQDAGDRGHAQGDPCGRGHRGGTREGHP